MVKVSYKILKIAPPYNIFITYPVVSYKVFIIEGLLPILGFIPILLLNRG